ncbi:unnamed protein product [Symbiodinium sp. KB8]|nr:unnamed protein product [Symbiodinium sp. KB8]
MKLPFTASTAGCPKRSAMPTSSNSAMKPPLPLCFVRMWRPAAWICLMWIGLCSMMHPRIPPSSSTAWEEPRVLGAVAGLWCTFARRRTPTCTCCQCPKCQFARRRSCHRSRNKCSAP